MSGSGRFSISDVYPSCLLLCASIRSVSTEENLHKGLVGMGVSDVTPPTIKSMSRPKDFLEVFLSVFRSRKKPPSLVLLGGVLYSPGGRSIVRSTIPLKSPQRGARSVPPRMPTWLWH
ncbi:hypothetical protein B296_00037307 [Ensete ventricosum]|uniref:Uncharacterized protein n=1 Tax=Ensete ventricosum TaxID=4639 RepID=A0A426YYY0_ENSVE|nr:hypothetical protein B296_00037307 [Ensete ventricosum]